jgi:hypothetical protein
LVLVVGLALVCAGAVKWRRYAELRQQIARCSREEKRLRAEYDQASRVGAYCGNQRRMAEAYLAVAEDRRREIEACERDLRRIW